MDQQPLPNEPTKENTTPLEPVQSTQPTPLVEQPTSTPQPVTETPSVGPYATQAPTVQNPASPLVPPQIKKKHKGLIIGLIAGGAVLLAAVAGWLAFAYVYNNPQNAVDDAFVKAMHAKDVTGAARLFINGDSATVQLDATFTQNSDQKLMADIALNAEPKESGAQRTTMNASIAAETDKLYVRLHDVKKLLVALSGASASEVEDAYGGILDKIDGRWVVITASDIENLTDDSTNSKQATCVQDEMKKLSSDETVRDELVKLYKKHHFFAPTREGTETINGTPSDHYSVELDIDIMKDYLRGLSDTKIAASLDGCTDGEFTKNLNKNIDTIKKKDFQGMSYEVWVHPWSHEITKVRVTADDTDAKTSASFEVLPKFNTNPTVTMPPAETTVDELMGEIQKLQEQMSDPADPVSLNDSPLSSNSY